MTKGAERHQDNQEIPSEAPLLLHPPHRTIRMLVQIIPQVDLTIRMMFHRTIRMLVQIITQVDLTIRMVLRLRVLTRRRHCQVYPQTLLTCN
jgi:hypothetical protein